MVQKTNFVTPPDMQEGTYSPKILVVEDHPLVIQAYRDLLSELFVYTDYTIVSNAEDIFEAVRKQAFDLILLDLMIFGVPILGNIEMVKSYQPNAKLLVISAYEDAMYASRCYQLGADGYVNKRASNETILAAIRTVMAGNVFFKKDALFSAGGKPAAGTSANENPFDALSKRELEIVIMLVAGHSINTISSSLNLSRSTVSTHKLNIFQKLRIENIIELKKIADVYGMHT